MTDVLVRTEPPDEHERRRITTELDATLFVEAGAGSGKTRSLVERIAALVGAGVPMSEIAAITFTEKAATELRDRVRRQLEQMVQGEDLVAAARAQEALHQLDGAAVSTLHAFAQRLLTELPLLAGLPPRVEVADEVESQLAFEERWAAFVDELLDEQALQADPDDEQALLLLLEVRRPLEALRDVALEFERNWDLVAERVHGRPVPPIPVVELGPLAAEARELASEASLGADGDRLVALLEGLVPLAEGLEAATTPREQLRAVHRLATVRAARNCGNRKNWGRGRWADDLDPLRDRVNALAGRAAGVEQSLSEAALRRLAARVAHFTVKAAEARRRQGALAFHDLLVLARDMLRHPERGVAARRVLHRRYTHLLLDEFQDTDPIQVEIASLLAADPGTSGPDAGVGAAVPGRLFFVGDPKQSIYRFRRADIATFLATRKAVGTEPVRLTANFRTAEPIVGWINAVFGHLIRPEPGAQPEYQPLTAVRSPALAGPPVLVAEGVHDGVTAPELRAREVADVVRAIRLALDAWEVADSRTGEARPARCGDIAILIPSRTVLDALEDGLDAAGIPYRTESSSLTYASREVRELLLALRVLDDPSDELALVTTLRSALFGCSDVDLYRWRRERGGSWDITRPPSPEPLADDPVHDALTYLHQLAAERHWLAPADLLDRLVRDRRVLEVAGTGHRARDVLRRVRYLLDQARAWREAGGATLRDYVNWAYRQAADGVRVNEAVLPETDHDAVRVMTIHAAKGLEFPIVVVAGLTTQYRGARAGVDVIWTPDGPPQLRLSSSFATRDYEVSKALDEQLDEHERRRLLYVACTRARDHLVVCLHRKRRSRPTEHPTLAELLADAAHGRAEHEVLPPAEDEAEPDAARASAATTAAQPSALAHPPPGPERWRADHEAMLAAAGRPRTAAATSFAPHAGPDWRATDDPGLAKGGVDLDLPPWQKGRYGTAIGRAVHAVLQTVDLATGEGLEAAAAAQAAAEGVLGQERTIANLARSALAAPTVQAAARAPAAWREVFVAHPFRPTLLEGYLDLLYRAPGGLVVVDYKTDQVRGPDDLDARVERYRLQLAAYALAVRAVTGEDVEQAVLVFCSPRGPAAERPVPDLAAAMAEVEQRLLAGTAGTPPPLLA